MRPAAEPLLHSLRRIVADRPDSVGLRDARYSLSFRECWDALTGGAQWLKAQGVRPGDRIVLCGANSVDFSLAYFAIHAAGAVAVPIGSDVSAAAAQSVVDQCRPTLILTATADQGTTLGASPLPELALWMAAKSPEEVNARALEEPADILFTTGTTGQKKGVLLTHANIVGAATNINAFIQPRESDVEVVPVPLNHSFGLGRLRCWAQIGHTLVLEPGLRNPALLYKRLIDVQATGLALVPAGVALLRRLIKDRFAEVGAHLRYLELGSAPLATEDRAWLLSMLPATRICHHYGLTEASRAVFCELHADSAKAGSIGRPSPNVEIMIADDAGYALPPGQSGEILVRGAMVMQGYWEQAELTAGALRDGWLRTGDEGWRDDEGYIFLRGRRGDIINVGGVKVSPEDVEQCLRAIENIRDAACIGVPDPRGVLGQVVKAYIVSDGELDEAAIVAALRERLPEHEVPKTFERISLIPKTASGKVMRAKLRAGDIS